MDRFIQMSEIEIAGNPVILKTIVGSCVAVCLWDPGVPVGGMAHIMLPQRNGDAKAPVGKYADTAISSLISRLKNEGANPKRFQAACVGGASMFMRGDQKGFTVGDRNIEAVKSQLAIHGIRNITESLGGRMGRKVALDCTNGAVTISTLQQKVQPQYD